jgi:hypothetical protein
MEGDFLKFNDYKNKRPNYFLYWFLKLLGLIWKGGEGGFERVWGFTIDLGEITVAQQYMKEK